MTMTTTTTLVEGTRVRSAQGTLVGTVERTGMGSPSTGDRVAVRWDTATRWQVVRVTSLVAL